jgi:protease II
VIGNLCYYIKITGFYEFLELVVCDAMTGKEDDMLYREKNEERYITLTKGSNYSLYLISSDPSSSSTYRIKNKELIPIYPKHKEQWPLGELLYGEECVMTRDKSSAPWTAHGRPICHWKLPDEDIEWVNPQTGHVITIREGGNTLWFCAPHKAPNAIFKVKVGSIDSHPWATWENQIVSMFVVRTPSRLPCIIQVAENQIQLVKNEYTIQRPIELPPLQIHRFHTPSQDGVSIPYILIMEKDKKPKGLFVYVYGAYGASTPIYWPYQTWYPLLTRNWAIVFALVRGGGDVDAAWADAARMDHRHRSIDDFEAVIRAAQKKVRCGPSQTVIYGRSAGGLPVGAMVSRYPNGDLMGAAFTEVPYVDVLRTSSNPDLPLTVGEYKEFGNPMTNILHFKELMSVSPINTVPEQGAPGVFVMSHVGLLDKQVFAYESFKWIYRLRGHCPDDQPQMKYVTFERNEAHQYQFHRLPRFRAIDFAILDTWVEGKLRFNS